MADKGKGKPKREPFYPMPPMPPMIPDTPDNIARAKRYYA